VLDEKKPSEEKRIGKRFLTASKARRRKFLGERETEFPSFAGQDETEESLGKILSEKRTTKNEIDS